MTSKHCSAKTTQGPSRRKILQKGAFAAGAALGFPAIVSSQSPNSKLHIAVIGAGGRGRTNLKGIEGEDVVALCDVNKNNLSAAHSNHKDAKTFIDFREMYSSLNDYDAVVISTTEHTHAFATLPALKAGKHVYCEKPLTRDVHEARIITEAAAAAKVATQMGTQIHASDNYRRVVELVQSEAVGPISECHVWVSRAWGHQSAEDAVKNKDVASTQDTPTETMPVPDELDWDRWIGPAPFRPFNEIYFPGPKWYRWWDFGNGTMSDLGSHWNDLPFWALNLDAPLTIDADGPEPHPDIAPASMSATYTYGQRGKMPPVELTWHQGANKPKIWSDNGIPQWASGVLFIGSDGMILSDYSKHVLLPEDKFANFTPPPQTIAKSLGHHAEWLHACRTDAPTTCDFSYSGPLTEANHLGNVAYRAGKKLEWDAATMKFTNAPEANKYLAREYRDGWVLA